MAKAGITLGFTAYERRDPVTGTHKRFLRSSTSRQSSPELQRFKSCVASAMRGFKASGSTPEERSRSIRLAFANAAKRCS